MMRIHGTFLISGRTAPLDEPLRAHIRRRLALALRKAAATAVWVQVTVLESIGRHGRINTRCRISAWFGEDGDIIAEATAGTAHEAVSRSLDRLALSLSQMRSRRADRWPEHAGLENPANRVAELEPVCRIQR